MEVMRLAAVLLGSIGLVALIVLSRPGTRNKLLASPATSVAPRASGEPALLQLEVPGSPPQDPRVPSRSASGAAEVADAAPERQVVHRPRAAALVLLFEHATHDPAFPGRMWRLPAGVHEAGVAFDDDDLSAIEVPPGLEVSLYDGRGLSGPYVTIGQGVHDLEFFGFNDRASSLRIVPVEEAAEKTRRRRGLWLVLFEDEPGSPEGHVWRLPIDPREDTQSFRSQDGWFPGRSVSSVEIPRGIEATLSKSKNGLGIALVLGPGLHRLDIADFNDRVQSIRTRWLVE